MTEDVGSPAPSPPRRATTREAAISLQRRIEQVSAGLGQEKGERPSVKETRVNLAGLGITLGVLADRLGDDEGLRPAVLEALEVLSEDYAMGTRITQAASILRRAI